MRASWRPRVGMEAFPDLIVVIITSIHYPPDSLRFCPTELVAMYMNAY
jgi:hypothetical protein